MTRRTGQVGTRGPRRRAEGLVRPAVAAVFVVVTAAVGMAGAPAAGGAERFDAGVDETVADIQAYWAATMPAVYGIRYEAIPTQRLFPYSQANPPPGCGTPGRMPYEEVAGNAFYCSAGDFVAWDTQALFPRLREQFGDFAPALVLAHEWGHAVQARVGFETYQTIYMEQQADCFAGAWTAHVAGGVSPLHLSDADLDGALAGLLQLRDPSGTDVDQEGAHGNGFDRVSAFQDGFEGGAAECAAYADRPPVFTQTGYTSRTDYLNGGDLGLDELVPLLTDSLSTYWDATSPELVGFDSTVGAGAPACPGGTDGGVLVGSITYCPSADTIAYDRATLVGAHDSIGDFAAGVLIAAGWSSAALHREGAELGTAAARQAAECLTGAYAATLDVARAQARGTRPDPTGVSLSPGDLDEVVAMLVASTGDGSDRGTAFTRVAAFRTGFVRGPSAC